MLQRGGQGSSGNSIQTVINLSSPSSTQRSLASFYAQTGLSNAHFPHLQTQYSFAQQQTQSQNLLPNQVPTQLDKPKFLPTCKQNSSSSSKHSLESEVLCLGETKHRLIQGTKALKEDVRVWGQAINQLGDDGYSIVSKVIKSRNIELLEKLIQISRYGGNNEVYLDINLPNKDGSNPLTLSLAQDKSITAKILSLKPKLNFIDVKQDLSVLMIAVTFYPDKLQMLFQLRSGLDLNLQNKKNQTALHIATMQKKMEVVESLLSAGALTDIPDSKNNTPILIAAAMGEDGLQYVIRLLQAKAKFAMESVKSLGEKIHATTLLLLSSISDLDSLESVQEQIKFLNTEDALQKSEHYETLVKIAGQRYGIREGQLDFIISKSDYSITFIEYNSYMVLENDFEKKVSILNLIRIEKHSCDAKIISAKTFAFSEECISALWSLQKHLKTEGEEIKSIKCSKAITEFNKFFAEMIKTETISIKDVVLAIIILPVVIALQDSKEKICDLGSLAEELRIFLIEDFQFKVTKDEEAPIKHLEDLRLLNGKLSFEDKSDAVKIPVSDLAMIAFSAHLGEARQDLGMMTHIPIIPEEWELLLGNIDPE